MAASLNFTAASRPRAEPFAHLKEVTGTYNFMAESCDMPFSHARF